MLITADLEAILSAHPDVPGVSIAIAKDYNVTPLAAGFARLSTGERMTTDHYLECASLSKTIAAAFAIDYFTKRGIPMTTSTNKLLGEFNVPWRITLSLNPPSGMHPSMCDEVNLSMLVNHTALGMHYVFGFPISQIMPTPLDLLDGSCEANGYKSLFLERPPGKSFSYSGGGFVVLQLLLEHMEKKSIQELTRDYLDSCGLNDFTFVHENLDGVQYAFGHLTRTKEVQEFDHGRLKFPPLAAGALCKPSSLLQFLVNLSKAYLDVNGCNGITHFVARSMLGEENLLDLGAMDFMRSKIGLGVFVAKAGTNRIMLHQAANDGFRGVYMVCFEGPDAGKGFVILVNGDNPAVYLQCELARYLLSTSNGKGLNFRHVNFSKLSSSFDMKGLKQETIVNLGLKELVLAAFEDSSVNQKCKL